MFRDDPGIDTSLISDCLARWYGIDAASITFLPIGVDTDAAALRVGA